MKSPPISGTPIDTILPSLVLLDIMLPEEDGLEILRKLRSSASTKRLPVMMLTAKGSEYDKVLGSRFRRRRLRAQALPA